MPDEPEASTDQPTGGSDPIEVSDDTLIRVGDGDPVKFSEYRPEGYIPQDEWTKKTQQLAQERQEFQQQKQQEINRLQQLYSQLQQQQQQGASQGAQQQTASAIQDLLERMEKRGGYAAPDDIRDYHQRVTQWAQGLMQQQKQLRDALKLMYQQQQQASTGVQALSQSQAQQQAQKFLGELKDRHEAFQDEEGEMLLRNLVDSYEPAQGESMEEFQEAMRQKADELANKIDSFAERRVKGKMDGARKAKSLGVPTKGGQVSPSSPIAKGRDDNPEDFTKGLAKSGFFDK